MGEDLKHIDDIFKQGLGDAQMTPPDGLFEQCLEQLDATNSVSVGNGVGTGWSGLATSTWAWLGAAAVIGVSVFVIVSRADGDSQVRSLAQTDSKNQSIEAPAEKSATAGKLQTNAELRPGGLGEGEKLKGTAELGDENGVNLGAQRQSTAEITIDRENPGVMNNQSVTENTNATSKNSRSAIPEQKLKPCSGLLGNWRPVIAENVGGSVTLDLVGAHHDVRVHWGDGEISMLSGRGETGGGRLNHTYFVSQRKNFTVKLVNKQKESASGLLCADSQRLNISVTPANEVTEVFVPDVFTPNGDGANDFFFVEMPKPLQFDITILDAKQRTVFRSNDYLSKWSGMCSENECKEDTYRVILAYKYSGDVEWKYIRKQIKLIR